MMPSNGIPGQPGGNNQTVRMPAQAQSSMARYTGRDARPAGQAQGGGQGRLRQMLGTQPGRRMGQQPSAVTGYPTPVPTQGFQRQPAEPQNFEEAQAIMKARAAGMNAPALGAGGLPYGTPQGPAGSQLSPSGEFMSGAGGSPPMGGDNIQYATSPVRSEGYMLPGFTGGSVGALPQQRGTPQQRGRGQGQGALRSMLARQRVRGGGGRMNMGQPRKYPTQIPVQQPASGVDALRTMVGR